MNAADYSVLEHLRDGRPLRMRAIAPADRDAMSAFIGRTSERTRYRRFFSPKSTFSEREIAYFLNVDFVSHVAVVAVLEEGETQVIAGVGRYIVAEPGRAEIAFIVDDPHQNLGIATRLLTHLVVIARGASLRELFAHVLAENASMLKVFKRSGLPLAIHHEGGVVNITLDLTQSDFATPAAG